MWSVPSMMINTCLLFFIIIFVNVSSNLILPEYEHCDVPLGMESGSITDNDLTSSSTHDISSVGPQMARIRSEIEGGAWCPDKPIGINSYEYLEIELRQLFLINSIETQGRFGNGQGKEYAEFYQVQYQRDNQSSDWITYHNKITNKTILNGNTNTYIAEKRSLSFPILAKRIRIIPYSTRWRTVCMRIELYGCPYNGGVISYKTSPSIDEDNTYDGNDKIDGIGKLVDGIIGGNDFSWLSWNKSPVSIEFHFDISRHFKTIQIYTMNNKYESVQIKFDNNLTIKHHIAPIESSVSTIYVDTIQLIKYDNIFLGKQIEFLFEFNNNQLLFLTEITFINEPAILLNTSSIINNTTNCSILMNNNNSTFENSSLIIFKFEWLTIFIISIILFSFILLLIFGFYRIRCRSSHHRLRQNSNLYYKSSQMTTTTSGSCESTSSVHDANTLPVKKKNHLLLSSSSNNYDDVTSEQQSMGSYIYPITSTTSLLQTTPSSSLFKGEQYAVIDGNYSSNTYKQWSTNNTFHYASSDIEQIDKVSNNQRTSLFNCILPRENLPSKCIHHPSSSTNFPANVDESKLIAIRKISESKIGEIYFGNYFINNETKCVLIKIIKTNLIHSSKEIFLNELEILSRLNHINISCLFGVQLNTLYLIQEYSHFGTLQDYFHTLSKQQTNDSTFQKINIYFAYQLANALQYLSHLNLIHTDIATRNCLFYSDYMIKLTDCAMALPQYEHEYWLGTNGQLIPLRWIAPEALLTTPTIKSDIYSYAVTLWEIWSSCSCLPYVSLTNEELYQCIIVRQNENKNDLSFNLSVPPDCPKEIYDLLCECWHIDGTKRPNIADIALYFKRHIDSSR
ncbi:unnamed protein product [Adineta steineri]|uniref:Uncharacterized protein n=1 Tax=Adineta steineri TaxID=433720 RepID=A0A813ND33_9BILA|nr:unnamed protein product [Adineta steineri]CAF3632990.1 unnamed protein product [Adineta steineri]